MCFFFPSVPFVRLLSSIKPGLVKKINRLPTPVAGLVSHLPLYFNQNLGLPLLLSFVVTVLYVYASSSAFYVNLSLQGSDSKLSNVKTCCNLLS